MSTELIIVLLMLAAAIAMFAMNKPRMDAVALIMLTILPFSGVISMEEALAGFSDSNIVLIAALFVIGDGLVRTGVARDLGDWLATKAGSSETKLLVLLMVVVCGLGSMMSSTAVTAIFIPVVLRIAQNTGTAPSQLMMPLSSAALISGMMTLIATAPNLVVNSELVRRGNEGFHFFSFTPFGIPVLALAIGYMLFARKWLSAGNEGDDGRSSRPSLREWVEVYKLHAREHRVRVLAGSPLADKTVAEVRLRDNSRANLIAIDRDGMLIQPTPNTALHVNDILFVDLFATEMDAQTLREQYQLEPLPLKGVYFTDKSQEIGMAEIILPATSEIVGKSVVEADLRSRYNVTVIGLRRGAEAIESEMRNEELRIGDTLLVVGPWRAIRSLGSSSSDFVLFNIPAELEEVLPVPGKSKLALGCLALVIGLMVTGVVPNVQAALIGCLLMGAIGCVSLSSSYRAIDWKTIVLIVGMLPFSLALQRTGGVEIASDALMGLVGGAGPRTVLATLFAITALLGMFISNTATAVLMAPIALTIADELGASPYPFAMIVALAASAAFMTPVSSPVNTLVVTPGNYSFGDFVRVGVPLTILVLAVSTLLVPILLPL